MYIVDTRDSAPIESERALRAYFTDACKPQAAWRVGTEREMIGVRRGPAGVGTAPSYDGDDGIGAVLASLAEGPWTPIYEGEHIIALTGDGNRGDAQVTIEPGGQLELAARPVERGAELEADLDAFSGQLADISERLGLAFLGVGFRPFGRLDEISWMPKGRYEVMRAYLPTRGVLAHEMMKRTATAQVNLDYASPDDAAEKMRAGMSVSAILTALYANSPIVDGADSDYQSYRARIWRDTDPDRCGLLPFVFEDGDIFDAYTEWALDVPLFFVYRGRYIPANGMTFRRFLRDGFEGHRATMDDWGLHLSTLFPEVRMKRYLEVRGCDSGARDLVLALGPLCRGFLYDADARAAATALTAGLSFSDRLALWVGAAERGLSARVPGRSHTLGELARELVDIARDGLARQDPDEVRYLDPVREIAATGRTQADALRDLWARTNGAPEPVIEALLRAG
ncbi:MAG: glutamate--cysteine ligase [Haliangiales bacterium]